MDNFSMRDEFGGEVDTKGLDLGFLINSRWNFECYDKDGNLKWSDYDRPNIMTHQGLAHILDVMFHDVTRVAGWYMAIVESNTAAAATMTYAIPAYTECVAYTGTDRPTFTTVNSSSEAITNSAAKCSYTMNASKTLYGAALVGGASGAGKANIIGDTTDATGILMCYSLFSSSKPVEDTDVFKTWATITAAHA